MRSPNQVARFNRRELFVGSGAGVAGLVIGGVVGNQLIGKPAPAEAPAVVAPAAGEGEAAPVSEYKAGIH